MAATTSTNSAPPRCGHCSTRSPTLLLCTGCRHTHYCNSSCQASARKRHKSVCSPRILRVPAEDPWQLRRHADLSERERREIDERESKALSGLAQRVVEEKIRPTVLRQDVIAQLAEWFLDMLLGPALPYNKLKNFERDVLNDADLMADAEIYVETLPGCHVSLIERNRGDDKKRGVYPPPGDELRVNDQVLRTRCGVMVAEFSKRMNVSDEALQKKAMDEFYNYYKKTIMETRPRAYNSYTGLSACMGDAKFMKRSEEIVMFALGLTKELKEETDEEDDSQPDAFVTTAPPPMHTLIVFATAMLGCVIAMPSTQSLDEYATIDTFTTSIFKDGLFYFTPLALGVIRMTFAFICMVVTIAKVRNGVNLKLTYLPDSKLRKGIIKMSGLKTQGFFTAWSWNLLGIAFFLSGLAPLLVAYDKKQILLDNPWILRAALVSFEIAAPSALFISFIVTYSLWPTAYKTHGPTGTMGFKSWVSLFQHDANTFMVLLELCLMGGIPVKLSHASFAPLYAGVYQVFMWCMANYWVPKHGPVFLYFFVDTTLGKKTTLFMIGLLSVIFVSFLFFALLEMGVAKIEHSEHGVFPNFCCVFLISSLLMKFND
ncbi:hypothetical protein HJC23_000190 [Cyclotella cryptica]|uniref:MYND-type domain-containing protein n=1 Tax=Cyclotella cryptica TaxID=29204 RepID=A0ABD3QFJ2_9STRA|eukprot:CCRYP_006364-RA/>CCRYP_006364-RA protein AED:0.03 eAED:0.03 QI:349/1/1/1/0/0/3/236/600